MGESTNPRATLRFDRRVRLEFRGATITSDAGLLACRELDDALGLTETANECLQESRGGRNVQHKLVGLLRQSVYSRLAGYEDTNDAERLAQDPTMRIIVGRRDTDRSAASTNTMSRFETEVLTQDGNVEGLDRLNAEWVDGAMSRTPHRRVILDMDSWDRARRVVAKVEWHRGELFPRVGFIVTNMTAGPEGVVRFYNGRGTAEQWIKEGKYALNWTRLSCHRFVANRVRLSLFILAYNLGNFLRRLCLPKAVRHWSLRSVQVKLIKMGGRLVRHSRRLIFQLSEVSVPRRLFQGVLDRIGRPSPAPS